MVSHLRGPSGLDASLLNQLFQQMNGNQDGSIDQSEFANSLAAAGQAPGAAQTATTGTSDASQLFSTLDTDGDGKLSKTELTGAFQQLSQDMKSVLLTQQEVDGTGQQSATATASTSSQSGATTPDGNAASGGATSSDDLNAAAEALLEMLQALSANAAATSFSPTDAGQVTPTGTDSSSASNAVTTRADWIFAEIDSNGDGTISQTAWDAAVTAAANGKTTGEATEAGQRSLHRGEHLHHSLMHFMKTFDAQQGAIPSDVAGQDVTGQDVTGQGIMSQGATNQSLTT